MVALHIACKACAISSVINIQRRMEALWSKQGLSSSPSWTRVPARMLNVERRLDGGARSDWWPLMLAYPVRPPHTSRKIGLGVIFVTMPMG